MPVYGLKWPFKPGSFLRPFVRVGTKTLKPFTSNETRVEHECPSNYQDMDCMQSNVKHIVTSICASMPPRLREPLTEAPAYSRRQTITHNGNHGERIPWGMAPHSTGMSSGIMAPPHAVAHVAPTRSRTGAAPRVSLRMVSCVTDGVTSALVFITVERCFSNVARLRILVNKSAGLRSVGM